MNMLTCSKSDDGFLVALGPAHLVGSSFSTAMSPNYSELRIPESTVLYRNNRVIWGLGDSERQDFSGYPWMSWNLLCKPGWPWTQQSTCLCLLHAGIKNATTVQPGIMVWSSADPIIISCKALDQLLAASSLSAGFQVLLLTSCPCK